MDLRLGEQQHELVRQGLRRADREGAGTPDNDARYELYGQAEDILAGENGDMPVLPIYWYTFVQPEKESVKDTFKVNLLGQTDLTKVVVKE